MIWNERKGTTSIDHDSESATDVSHCRDPGCYTRNVTYNATIRQMISLVELSQEYHQSNNANHNLPLTRLNFGWTFSSGSSRVHTLGRLQCSVVSGTPQSCADVWKGGRSSSGIFSIRGKKQVVLVFCDMNKFVNDSGTSCCWLPFRRRF